MTESKLKTKRKVDLVSSHSDRDSEDSPLAAYSLEGSLFTKETIIPCTLNNLLVNEHVKNKARQRNEPRVENS